MKTSPVHLLVHYLAHQSGNPALQLAALAFHAHSAKATAAAAPAPAKHHATVKPKRHPLKAVKK